MPDITVYGAAWCPDCHRARQFLGEHQIPYGWVDVDDEPEGERLVLEVNEGRRRIPTLVFADGSTLTNPTNAELADRLGLETRAERHHYDLIVVGGGPAGLTAALYTAREGIDTLVVERAALGGQAAATFHLDNVPGFPEGISGDELAGRFRAQAQRFGVEMLQAQDAESLCARDGLRCLRLADGTELTARAILLATGSKYRRLGVPGEDEFLGSGVHYCATCDGPFYKGRSVAVIGGGNSAAEEAVFLTRFVDRVTLLVRGEELSASQIIREEVAAHVDIELRTRTVVDEFEGAASKLSGLRIRHLDRGTAETLAIPGAFVFIGLDPNTGYLRDSEIRLDEQRFVVTGHSLVHRPEDRPPAFAGREPAFLETSVPGVFAAGDVRSGSTKQVASAAGEGAAAALMIRDFLGST